MNQVIHMARWEAVLLAIAFWSMGLATLVMALQYIGLRKKIKEVYEDCAVSQLVHQPNGTVHNWGCLECATFHGERSALQVLGTNCTKANPKERAAAWKRREQFAGGFQKWKCPVSQKSYSKDVYLGTCD